jgi:hypothetical protein
MSAAPLAPHDKPPGDRDDGTLARELASVRKRLWVRATSAALLSFAGSVWSWGHTIPSIPAPPSLGRVLAADTRRIWWSPELAACGFVTGLIVGDWPAVAGAVAGSFLAGASFFCVRLPALGSPSATACDCVSILTKLSCYCALTECWSGDQSLAIEYVGQWVLQLAGAFLLGVWVRRVAGNHLPPRNAALSALAGTPEGDRPATLSLARALRDQRRGR